MQLALFPSKDAEKERVLSPRSDNITFKSFNDANENVDELIESLRLRYQGNLETSMRGADFIFDSVQMMCYKCQKVNLKRWGSYITFPGWIKKRKSNNKSKK